MTELTRTFTQEQYDQALAAWEWIGLEGLDPWFTSAFGDLFLTGPDGVYWLDLTSGELTRPWRDLESAKKALSSDEGLDEYLLAGLVFAAAEAGVEATDDQILGFKVPPVLDGEFEVANLVVADFVEVVSAAGHLHDQIKDLPDGAEIEGFD